MDTQSDLTLPSNWRIDCLPRTGSIGFIWREQVALPRYALQQDVDVLHAPGATGPLRISIPLVVTIYDTIEFTDPLPSIRQTKRWAMRLYSRFIQARTAKLARHVITISEYSKHRIVERLGISPEKVTTTHLAPDPRYSPTALEQTTFGIGDDKGATGYVLGIASAAPRKNIGALLTAYAHLPKALRQDHQLVLVCTHADVTDMIRAKVAKLSISDYVQLLQRVKDSELVQIYRRAGVFVFPSLKEGFGLPPLEAMACGTPVIASNTSSLPEVLGDAAILVTPTDILALTHAIERVLTDHILADDLRKRGLIRSQQFSWEKTARETLTVYERVVTQGRN